jgi:hypothetical protein
MGALCVLWAILAPSPCFRCKPRAHFKAANAGEQRVFFQEFSLGDVFFFR